MYNESSPRIKLFVNGANSERFVCDVNDIIEIELRMTLPAESAKLYVANEKDVLLSSDCRRFISNDGVVFSGGFSAKELSKGQSGLLFFHFEAETAGGRVYTVCEPADECSLDDKYQNDFQLLVTDNKFSSPEWLNGGVIYQVFVDRFCKSGLVKNHRADTVYNDDWENGIPEYPSEQSAAFPNNTHFGGDLYGVASKIPYLKSLGVSCIYLSPVFKAYSNHKYDVGDYLCVDESFGGNEALQKLITRAHKHNISVILDGVFNHVGDDSLYFNKYGRYDSLGAYQSKDSPYYSWFSFTKFPEQYDSWWGCKNLPKTVKNKDFCDFICDSVIPAYMKMGIDGWRLDVVDELDNSFTSRLCAAIKREKKDAVIIGEVWEDASNKIAYDERKQYFYGSQLDGVTNYPLRNGIISFLTERDSSLLCEVMQTLYRHYPKEKLLHTMNIIGTHDTSRILTLLGGECDIGFDNDYLAHKKMTSSEREKAFELLKFGYTLLASLPGVPCIYYGDEAGLEGYHDPFNRMPFNNEKNERLFECFSALNRLRAQEPLFKSDGFRILHSPSDVFAFERFDDKNKLFAVVNLSHNAYTFNHNDKLLDIFGINTYNTCNGRIEVGAESALIVKTDD